MRWTSARRIRTASRSGGDRAGGVLGSGCEVVFLGDPDRSVSSGDHGVAAAVGLAGADQRAAAALIGGQFVLALGLRGVEHAVVDGSQMEVVELSCEQGRLGLFIGDLRP